MERLNNKKFSKLSEEEMRRIEGGWGWRIINVGYVKLEGASEGSSVILFQYHNIWGNPVEGRYKEEYD